MKRILTAAAVALLMPVFAAPSASAQTVDLACFDWTCDAASTTCDFDASCSGDSQNVALDFRWKWGDGSTIESFWQDPTATHTYPYNQQAAYITLSVGYMFIGYYDVTCRIQIYSPIGPVQETFSGHCT